MKVTKFWQGKESMEGRNHSVIASNVLELLHQGVGLNTTGSVYKAGVSGVEFSGSPTEKAILSWAVLELNIDMEAVKRDCEILHVEAFNSEKKRSGVLMKKVEDGTFHVHWKGAAEMILAMCSHYYDMEGNMKALSDCERTKFDQIIQGMAASSLRCIAFAHKQIGDQVPADGLFIEGHSLQVDESSMTGESDQVEVSKDQHPFVFSGTKVADGYAKMLVTSVGMSTTWGEMMSTISCSPDEQTPLQARLNKLTSSIGKGWKWEQDFNGNKTRVDDVINAVVGIIAAAVTIIVVAIPEGLPLAVTLTLAYSMKRMMADQAMVTRFWLGKESMEGEDVSVIAPDVLNLLHQGVGLNTTGSIYRPAVSGIGFEFSGSPTEKAILSWAALELNMDIDKQDFTVLSVEAFNSEKKRSGVFLKNVKEGTVHAHWKGAAEMILAMCSHYYDAQGNITSLDVFERLNFSEIIQGMACSSLRCIAFACKQVIGGKLVSNEIREQIPDNGLTLLALVGLKDPCRPGAKQAVEDCQYAGVNVKMITGDNIFTARTIAMECGILSPDQEVNDGSVVEVPEKERPCVAVTGDGTNDAPALREADIGLSMGIQGTEVAKESSDIVILDDNFASVATVLRWGDVFTTTFRNSSNFSSQ
ncbi:UNVERIFIED_CONTAM: Calcium-transporting ATPase 12, plasma membrane-type [Sesamum angustifolium]|uniref:Calcium-transporting ATPase 12, plasma membrane-type n=1 Tax=Sesamum angustifolium TaxID=2727405 RepID=A0AAW2MIA1_9LAMI